VLIANRMRRAREVICLKQRRFARVLDKAETLRLARSVAIRVPRTEAPRTIGLGLKHAVDALSGGRENGGSDRRHASPARRRPRVEKVESPTTKALCANSASATLAAWSPEYVSGWPPPGTR